MPAARPSLLAIGQWRMSLIQARNAGCLSAGRAAPRPAGVGRRLDNPVNYPDCTVFRTSSQLMIAKG